MNLSAGDSLDGVPIEVVWIAILGVIMIIVLALFLPEIIGRVYDHREHRRALTDIKSCKQKFDVLRGRITESGVTSEIREDLRDLYDTLNEAWSRVSYPYHAYEKRRATRMSFDQIAEYRDAFERVYKFQELASQSDFNTFAQRASLLAQLESNKAGTRELLEDVGFVMEEERSNLHRRVLARFTELWTSEHPVLFDEIRGTDNWQFSVIIELLEQANCFEEIGDHEWNKAIIEMASPNAIHSEMFRGITINTVRDIAAALVVAIYGGDSVMAFYLWLRAVEDECGTVSTEDATMLTELTYIVWNTRADLVPHPCPDAVRPPD